MQGSQTLGQPDLIIASSSACLSTWEASRQFSQSQDRTA
jgi:hypothetical protein